MTQPGPRSMTVYDGRQAYRGRRLNAFFLALREDANRVAFRADPGAVYDRFALDAEERALVEARDWTGLLRAGLSVYAVSKAQAVLDGVDLLDVGADLHGMERAAFIDAQRRARETA